MQELNLLEIEEVGGGNLPEMQVGTGEPGVSCSNLPEMQVGSGVPG